ncbi:hypothetical protein ACIQ6Y_12715 [Streptomyces sp. NPDC096205]|uniref:hypothetical protein n=1 Tax=Streptomyces sp. NPDC096205 TaxID=3366081 RepID=UPI0037F9A351
MLRKSRVWGAAAAVVVLGVAGCGGGGGGGEVPSAGGASSGRAGGEKDALAEYVEGKRAWVACMRENGVDLDDPDEKGQVEIGGDGDTRRRLKLDPAFMAATEKCASVDPPVPDGLERSLNPLTPEQVEVRQKYANCMRENGASDFPDPGPDGYGEGEWDQTSAGARRAARVCAPIIGEPSDPPPAKG